MRRESFSSVQNIVDVNFKAWVRGSPFLQTSEYQTKSEQIKNAKLSYEIMEKTNSDVNSLAWALIIEPHLQLNHGNAK